MRWLAVGGVIVIALVTPGLLVVNGLRLVAHDWIVTFEYGREGFPADRYGLESDARETLALTGLDAIRPGTEGVALLRRATLPDGSTAFDARELSHMEDVRRVFGGALRLQLVVVVVLAAAALALRRRLGWVVPAGLAGGGLATLALAVVAIPVILLGFDGFFVRFHGLFFEGDSWRFSETDTLLRLYPERFWSDVAQLVAAITLVQASLLAVLAGLWLRRGRRQERAA